MNRRHLFWLVLPLTVVTAVAAAAGLELESAWARATPPGATVAAVYLRIDNTGGPADRLLAIKSPVATSAELHRTSIEDGIARMRQVSTLHVGANEVLEFVPGGLHIMLFGLKKPLVAGQAFELELVFEVVGPRRMTVTVRET